MAWTTSRLVLLAGWVGCADPGPARRPDGPKPDKGDSGAWPRPTEDVPCAFPVPDQSIILLGQVPSGLLGYRVDVTPDPSTGCSVLVVNEPRWSTDVLEDPYTDFGGLSVYALQAPWTAGRVVDHPGQRLHREDGFSGFGLSAHRLPDSGQWVAYGGYSKWAAVAAPFPGPRDQSLPAYGEDLTSYGFAGVPSMSFHRRCYLGRREGLCGVDRRSPNRVVPDGPTHDLLFMPAPLLGWRSSEESPARYGFDFSQALQAFNGDHDLDGDGSRDWLFGANQYVDPATQIKGGAVGVLLDPQLGDHDLWASAQAVYTSSLPDCGLGATVAAHDLDGDGHLDVGGGGSAITNSQAALFAGPHQGQRSDQQATWRVQGDGFLGIGLALGDYDGDGQADLAVGQPGSVYDPDPQPGKVYLFFSPPPGQLEPQDADLVLTTDRDEPDGFGLHLATATLDADHRDDLVVTAHRDNSLAPYGGALHLHFGAQLAHQAGR